MQASLTRQSSILLFLLMRAIVTGTLFLLTSGDEVASDARFHHLVFDRPLAILTGTADFTVSSYPPLQALLEWPLFTLANLLLPEFLAFRVMFVLIELMAFLVLLKILERMVLPAGLASAVILLFIIGPQQLLASTVFIQDELICQLFVLLALWCLLDDRKGAALMMLVAGILFGKVFLVLPLFYLTFFYRPRPADGIPWLILAFVYALNVGLAISNDGNIPFVGFAPDPTYGSHYFTWLIERYPALVESMKRQSLWVSVIVQAGLCLAFVLQSRWCRDPLDPWVLMVVPASVFFFTFYQHNPEYLLTVWPVMILASRNLRGALFCTAVVAFAWVPNLMFGLMNIGLVNSSKSDTRNRVLQPFIDWIGIDFAQLHPASILLYSAAYAVMLVLLLAIAWRSSRQPLPISDRLPS